MDLILEKGNLKFLVDKQFNIKYLSPVLKYVQWKLENDKWDDYNEFYHASKLIENLKTQPQVWFDTHLMVKNGLTIGIMFIVGGKIGQLENKYSIDEENESLLLKYLHIVEKGKGYGSLWLNSGIIPFYKEKSYKQIYVNSSHKASFPFYERLGRLITKYELQSDNNLYKREGSCYMIEI